jgi:hypothetical protein
MDCAQMGCRKTPGSPGGDIRLIRSHAIAHVVPRIPLAGDLHNLRLAIRLQLPDRIDDRFPASRRRGRREGPTAEIAFRAVLVRECRREGFSSAEIAGAFLGEHRRDDRTTLKRWETTLQRLERAEGTSTPEMPDPSALKAVAHAKGALKRCLERLNRMTVAADRQARSEGLKGKALEARMQELLFAKPRFWELMADARTLAAKRDQALTAATGKPPLFPAGDPRDLLEKASKDRAHAKRLGELQQLKPAIRSAIERCHSSKLPDLLEICRKSRREDTNYVTPERPERSMIGPAKSYAKSGWEDDDPPSWVPFTPLPRSAPELEDREAVEARDAGERFVMPQDRP